MKLEATHYIHIWKYLTHVYQQQLEPIKNLEKDLKWTKYCGNTTLFVWKIRLKKPCEYCKGKGVILGMRYTEVYPMLLGVDCPKCNGKKLI